MLVVLPPIFVADTKIIYGYNFIAPLKKKAFVSSADFTGFKINETFTPQLALSLSATRCASPNTDLPSNNSFLKKVRETIVFIRTFFKSIRKAF